MSTVAETINKYQKRKKIVKPSIKKEQSTLEQIQTRPAKPVFVPSSSQSVAEIPEGLIIDGMKETHSRGSQKTIINYKRTGADTTQQQLQKTLAYWDNVLVWLISYGKDHSEFKQAFEGFLNNLE